MAASSSPHGAERAAATDQVVSACVPRGRAAAAHDSTMLCLVYGGKENRKSQSLMSATVAPDSVAMNPSRSFLITWSLLRNEIATYKFHVVPYDQPSPLLPFLSTPVSIGTWTAMALSNVSVSVSLRSELSLHRDRFLVSNIYIHLPRFLSSRPLPFLVS